jgi:phosphinothricin acetyltransferase
MTLSPGFQIRLASASDLGAINAIYNHYVVHSTCTYQTEPSTELERSDWFAQHGPKHPVIVAVSPGEGSVVGWGSLNRFHPRQAYGRTVEDSVYVHPNHQRRGLGRAILTDLIQRADALGHHTVLGGISADQEASIALHAALGFEKVSHLREVGFKFDRWLDVIWMQRML